MKRAEDAVRIYLAYASGRMFGVTLEKRFAWGPPLGVPRHTPSPVTHEGGTE